MAIFERVSTNVVPIDDTVKLSCDIENTQNVNNHTEYNIRVRRGSDRKSWHVSKRYKDFAALHSCFQHSSIPILLPPKKLLGNMQPAFISERLQALQRYLLELTKHHVLSLSLPVRRFLDPANYPLSIHELALQNVSIALRCYNNFQLRCTMKDIGWRIRKKNFLVSPSQEKKVNYILSWQYYGPDKCLTENELQRLSVALMSINSPYIDKINEMHTTELGAFAIRKIHPKGTIKDHLYDTSYSEPYLNKYCNPKTRKPFTISQVAHYGHQILEALIFLRDLKIPYCNLHVGNVAIENQRAVLLDIENCALGLRSLYRQNFVELRHLNSIECIDIYCFGKTIYEMTYADCLTESTCDNYPGISLELESLLRQCIPSTLGKHAWPNLEDLLNHQLFRLGRPLSNGAGTEVSEYNVSSELQDALLRHSHMFIETLRSEQKTARSARREVRIKEILKSETELKKQRRKSRLRSNEWRSCSSLAQSSCSSPTTQHINDSSVASTSRSASPPPQSNDERSALLNAISSFNKNKLRAVNGAK